MQTEIALSTTEAEYIALSQAMREVLPIIWLMEEARHQGIPVLNATPKIYCKVFEVNAGAIEIANVPKMRPRTKHLNIKYHHFREEVKKGTISIYHTRTEEQGRHPLGATSSPPEHCKHAMPRVPRPYVRRSTEGRPRTGGTRGQ
jgi:hypothetical protein